ncbi:MAG TPA: pitrilysin family protein [Candidatus Kapabacteria bacterium]|nr:pitrilysin family protein [Candidatus Kapabacteria bacterium]
MRMHGRSLRTLALSIATLAVAMLVSPAARAQSDDEQRQPGIVYRGAPTNVKEFTVGGIDVILRPTGKANHVIAAKLFIRGAVTALPEGASPALEELALALPPMSGPKGMTKVEYRRTIDRMVTGIIPGAGRDFSTMTLRCIDEKFNESWDLFTGVIMRPQFDAVELRNAVEAQLLSVRNRYSSPGAYAAYLADSAFFAGHPYGRFDTEADIKRITPKMLEEHYRRLFVKSRLLLVVVGNVDSADLHRKVAASFAKLPMGSYVEQPLPVPPAASEPRVIVRAPVGNRDEVPTNYIIARFMAPNRDDSLYYPMMRLAVFLSGSLFREVRMERNLSYAPDADANFGKTSFGEISMQTTLPDSAWRVTMEQVDFFRRYVIADQYITSGLSAWITNTYMREQTNESQANELGVAQLYTGSWTNAFRTIEAIQKMTPEQLNEAAQRYLRNMTVVIVGDPSRITPAEYLEAEEG